MIEQLTLTSDTGERVVFSRRSPYFVNIPNDVTGLHDLETERDTESLYGRRGEVEMGYRLLPRYVEISGTINLREAIAALDAKRSLSRLLLPEHTFTLTYTSAAGTRFLIVRPEKAPVFSRTQVYTRFAINLVAPDPLWNDPEVTETRISGTVKMLTFPVRLPESGWVVERRISGVEAVNNGDVACEMRIRIAFLMASAGGTSLTLRNLTTGSDFQFSLPTNMNSGDVLVIDRMNDMTSMIVISATGVETDYTNTLRYAEIPAFPTLAPGNNAIVLEGDGTETMSLTIEHVNLYAGG